MRYMKSAGRLTKHKKQASTVRNTATIGLRYLQLTVCLALLMASLSIFGQDTEETPADFDIEESDQAFASEQENLRFRADEEAPKFFVPPDPTQPYLDAIDRLEEELGPYAVDLAARCTPTGS